MKRFISLILAGTVLCSLPAAAAFADGEEVKVYVSVNGDDANDGKMLTSAVKTVNRAIELERKYKRAGEKTHIIFKGGTYKLDGTINLTAEDSGEENAPVVFRAYQGDSVRFTMGDRLEPDQFTVSQNSEIAEGVKGKIYEISLSDFENVYGGLGDTFYADGELQQLARFPNRPASKREKTHTFTANEEGSAYLIPDDKRSAWANKTDMYYMYQANNYEWAGDLIRSITDTEMKMASGNVVIYNALSEVDEPGEYYIDKEAKKLYYYPKSNIRGCDMYLATNSQNFVSITGASDISFEGIDFICSNAKTFGANKAIAGFYMKDCQNITIYDSSMKALGAYAVYTENTNGLKILKCDISDIKGGAINISGGDSVKLISSGNIIRNCYIHDVGNIYKTARGYGVYINGVGTEFSHNEVYNCPSIGVAVHGNDNIIEKNRIHDTMLTVWDSGAIYLGRTWIGRGNVIRNNYIYDSFSTMNYTNLTNLYQWGGTDNQAVYLDDIQSGVEVSGNIIYNMSRGFLIGGGSDNTINDNIVINSRRGFEYDRRGQGPWGYKHLEVLEQYAGYIYRSYKALLADENYDEALWKSKYSGFTELLSRTAAFDSQVEGMTDLNQRAAIIKSTIGKVYNRQIHNNVYLGSYADDYVNGKYSDYIREDIAYNYDDTQAENAADEHSFTTADEAGVSINGYEITINGNVPEGISKTTAGIGVSEESYEPSYSQKEFDINSENLFIAVVAVYDETGVLRSVKMSNQCYINGGQVIGLDIDVPQEADEGWYAAVMMVDNMAQLKPVLKEKISLFK